MGLKRASFRMLRVIGRNPFQTLAARIGYFVFGATLISALAVAGTSAFALRAFLRGKVEGKIPAAVAHARDRLELWYAQRTLDIEVFARSAIVVDGLTRLASAGKAGGDPHDRAEVEQYLGYVRAGLPQYAAIFALDAQGRVLTSVGNVPALEPGVLRQLAASKDVQISPVLTAGDGVRLHAVSCPVVDRREKRVATLHALVALHAIEEQLAASVESGAGRVLVFDQSGDLVTSAGALKSRVARISPQLAGAATGEVRAYVAPDGVRVVASTLPFPRLHWTLVFEEAYESAFAPIASILGRTVGLNLGIVLVLSALAFVVVTYLVRPLHALSDCAMRLRDGEEDVKLPVVVTNDEVGILTRSFGEMVASLKRANETLEQLAITDGLTKIHNHRFFQDQLTREIKRCERTGSPLALVLIDIDDFKALNDRHGHAVGDGVLERMAKLLLDQVRAQDLVARYGGEEFAILAPDTDREAAIRMAEKIRLAVSEHEFHVPPAEQTIVVTVSVGVAWYHDDRQDFFVEADRALYAAKHAGKDCVIAAEADE